MEQIKKPLDRVMKRLKEFNKLKELENKKLPNGLMIPYIDMLPLGYAIFESEGKKYLIKQTDITDFIGGDKDGENR